MAFNNTTESSILEPEEVIPELSTGFIVIEDFQAPAKLHVGLLSISLIVGLAYGGYVGYMCWREKKVFLSHVRNLVIALTCRTFFSILFEGVIILNSPWDVGGGNALLAFECICLNLVLAYWLTLTLYIRERVQTNFNSEPSLTLYVYGVTGLSVYFALVWIFAMEGTLSSEVWWIFYYFRPFYQWVVNSLRLLFLLAQLALLFDTAKMMMVKATDNDTISLLRKVAIMMGVLVLLFWLQFGLSVGRPASDNIKPYLYFYYLIDGTQCLFVCVILFFFNMWVQMILDKLPNVMENEGMARTGFRPNDEVSLGKHSERNIVTIDSVFMTEESKRWTNKTSDSHESVVYSSVVKPENLQKTIDLYKRLNVIPNDKVTIVEGEKFYDCDLRGKRVQNLDESPSGNKRVNERLVKKNAFYASKYLIVESKEKENIPKYLQTRSWSYTPGMETPKEELPRDPSRSLETLGGDELVVKWLKDHSDDMPDVQKAPVDKEKRKSVDGVEVSKTASNMEEECDSSLTQKIVPVVKSVLIGTLFPPKVENNLSEENVEVSENADVNRPHKNSNPDETNTSHDHYVTSNEEKSTRECEKIQDLQNNLKPNEDVRGPKQNENEKPKCPAVVIEEVEELQKENDKIRDVKLEDDAEKPTIGYNSNKECDDTPSGSVTPIKDKKTPPDCLSDIETDGLKYDANPQKILKMEIEKHPETFAENIRTEKQLDNKNAQHSNLDYETRKDSEESYERFTLSDLLAFRAEMEKSETETDKSSEFSLTSSIYSTLNAAINYSGSFFRSKNEEK